MKRLGVIVNPIAGMGGKVGLKGTDTLEILERARELGATPVSPDRAIKALQRIAPLAPAIEILTCPYAMGADEINACGLDATVVGSIERGEAGAADTANAAKNMLDAKVDLLLFAGGDGTARDIYDAVGNSVPMLGIPTGVKMHSAVFGTSPESAGYLAALYLEEGPSKCHLRDAEVMDIDEAAVRANRLSATLYGYAKIPYQRRLVQSAKAGAMPGEAAATDAVCWEIVNNIEDQWLYIIGPGTTTARLLELLGLQGTLLGVDAIYDRKLIGSDLNENQLLELMDGRQTKIVVTVIGGHGCIFGRGNQQISAEVIGQVGKTNIIVLTTMNKIQSLEGRPLFVDTGDDDTDEMLSGFIRVTTGLHQSTMLKIGL